ncbi:MULTISPECIES: DUF6316 family protein [Marinobacter]|uniref:DUF6316 family protein n=1 Tax=Marinobacter TaxID=2742 RepID=UPI000DAE2B1B|nr:MULTISPECIES: DUF6316 family protein [Marinobacter]
MSVQQKMYRPVRSERFVHTLVGWYVRTREAVDLGPFGNVGEAESALERHISQFRDLPRAAAEDGHSLGMEVHDPDTCRKRNCAICMEAHIASQHRWQPAH